MPNIIRPSACDKKIGLKKTAVYDKLDPRSPRYDASFPKPIRLGLRAVGFLEHELDEWIEARIKASRSPAKMENGATRRRWSQKKIKSRAEGDAVEGAA